MKITFLDEAKIILHEFDSNSKHTIFILTVKELVGCPSHTHQPLAGEGTGTSQCTAGEQHRPQLGT